MHDLFSMNSNLLKRRSELLVAMGKAAIAVAMPQSPSVLKKPASLKVQVKVEVKDEDDGEMFVKMGKLSPDCWGLNFQSPDDMHNLLEAVRTLPLALLADNWWLTLADVFQALPKKTCVRMRKALDLSGHKFSVYRGIDMVVWVPLEFRARLHDLRLSKMGPDQQ